MSADPARPNPLRCPVCDAESRVIPGAYYTEASRERFDRVAVALHNPELTQEQRASAVAFLDRAARDSDTDADALSQMLVRIPALSELASLIPSERNERHAFVGLLLSLLVAGVSGQHKEAPRAPSPALDPATSSSPSPDKSPSLAKTAPDPSMLEPSPTLDESPRIEDETARSEPTPANGDQKPIEKAG